MEFRRKVYLDNNATTQIDERVAKKIKSFVKHYGNPSSHHSIGKYTGSLVETARKHVSELINAEPEEIIFTSGGTEANNMILKGVASSLKEKGNHIITSRIEHPSIIETCEFLKKQGFQITYLPVNSDGLIDLNELEKAINDKTILISIMSANNEIGSIQDIKHISEIAHSKNILFHTDAVQAVGKIPIDAKTMDVDFLTYSSHKIYGPKGIGALYFKTSENFENLIHGGYQEFLLRGGTENTIGIIGFGEAAKVIIKDGLGYNNKIRSLRSLFINSIKDFFPNIKVNGPLTGGLSGTINLLFPETDNNKMIALLDYYGICASTGSACSEGGGEASHVLKAIGLSNKDANSSIRFSIGKYSSKKDIKYTVKKLKEILNDKINLHYLLPKEFDESMILNKDYLLVDIRSNFQRKITKPMAKAELVDHFKTDKYFNTIPKNKNIILICELGSNAINTGYKLKKRGFSNVMVLFGGYISWKTIHPDLFKKYVEDN
ncbi:MAG: IscS subfamily cysteine desulfurase [Candidatus Marinimicrobia bacterium]|nr:IscS subfamily cysteine desulfurase [Candidatus Neomarinimicrobiota bacterium]